MEEKKLKQLKKEDLINIVKGACFLGSGGGGGYDVGMNMANAFGDKDYYGLIDTIKVLSPDSLSGYDYGVIVAYMGAPQKMAKVKYPVAPVAAVQKILSMEKYKGKQFCIVPVEIGAISTMVACLTAAKLGIPVVDVDGAGRAVPTLNLITFSTEGISVNPTILASHDNPETVIELNISDSESPNAASRIESFARPTLGMADFDQMGGLAMWVMDIKKVPDMVIKETLTLCKELGENISGHNKKIEDTAKGLIQFFNESGRTEKYEGYYTKFVCEGLLSSAETKTSGGFDFGVIKITDNNFDYEYTILFQNECLILWDKNSPKPLVMAPDLISYIIEDESKQWVYSNDGIMENGQLKEKFRDKKAIVLGLQAPLKLIQTENKLKILLNKMKAPYQNNMSEESKITIPQNYMSLLNTMGYYGAYSPISEENE